MAILDPVKNFAKGILASGIVDGIATSMTLQAGQTALFPTPVPASVAFNVVIYNSTDFNNPSDDPDKEIVRVTDVSGDSFTIVRGQEGTTGVAHNTAGKDYVVALALTKKTMDDIESNLVGNSATLKKTITQTAHGFTVDQVVHSSGTDGEFSLAQADVVANAEVSGIVTQVIDADTFVLTIRGFMILATPIGVAGDTLFLDDLVAGGLTITEPTTGTTVSKPLAEVIDASTGLIILKDYRGQENQSIPGLGGFGAWASKNSNTIYQATRDCLVIAWGYPTAGGTLVGFTFNIVTDSNPTPTTMRVDSQHNGNISVHGSIACPVKAGDYYKVNCHTTGPFPSDDYSEVWEMPVN